MFRIQLTSNLADQNRQNIQLVRHNEKQKKKKKPQKSLHTECYQEGV